MKDRIALCFMWCAGVVGVACFTGCKPDPTGLTSRNGEDRTFTATVDVLLDGAALGEKGVSRGDVIARVNALLDRSEGFRVEELLDLRVRRDNGVRLTEVAEVRIRLRKCDGGE